MPGILPASRIPGAHPTRLLVAAAPIFLFAVSCWAVTPTSLGGNISLSYLIPFTFAFSLLLVPVPRADFLRLAGRLKVEFALLLILIIFAFLSLLNSSEPFRAFRTIFPCVLPLLLFLQFAALRSVSPKALAAVPRVFVFAALAISTTVLFASMAYPPLAPKVFITHRFVGFFENANQHSIALATTIPIALAELSIARGRRQKLLWFAVFALLLYTLLRTGSKTALLVSLAAAWAFYILIHFRAYSPFQRLFMTLGMVLIAAFIALFGIKIAGMIDPILASKLEMIFSGGVGNYYSIQSRQELWNAAIESGSRHWLVGAGAGEMILGVPHAHNLILDYFRGLGIIGALGVLLLCAAILFRTARKTLSFLAAPAGPGDIRVFACYVSGAIYVVCNQLSDCFGPTTIAALWLLYLPAVFSEHCANSLAATPSARPQKPRRTPAPFLPSHARTTKALH